MKKKIFKIILLTLIFCTSGCNKKTPEVPSLPNTDVEEKVVFKEYDMSKCKTEDCDEKITIGKNTLNIINSEGTQRVLLNDNEITILNNGYITLDKKIYSFDDSFVYGEVGSGIVGLYIVDSNYLDSLHVSYVDKYDLTFNSYKVDESGIEFTASKMYDNVLPTPEGGETIDTCEKFNKYKDTYVYGKFKYTYDKDTASFGDYKEVEIKKLSDMNEFSSLCN